MRKKSSHSIEVDEAGGERREGVEQDAPGEHAAAAEPVGEIAAEQTEDAAERPRAHRTASPIQRVNSGVPGAAPISSSSAGRTISGSISSS